MGYVLELKVILSHYVKYQESVIERRTRFELKKAQDYSPKYEIAKIQPYDMFPQTKHVETMVEIHLK